MECPNAPRQVPPQMIQPNQFPHPPGLNFLRLGYHQIVEDGVPMPERGERAYLAPRHREIPIPEGLHDRLEQARRLAGGLDLGPVAMRIPEEAPTDSGPGNPEDASIGSAFGNPEDGSVGSASENPEDGSVGSASENPEDGSVGSASENPEDGSIGSVSENSENQSMGEPQSKRQRCESP